MVQNDILEAFDNRQDMILVLLDQSAAFDTIDHLVLVSRPQRRFGITGVASAWIESYLSERSQSVVLSGNTSHSSNLPYEVPQGSVLGPLLFTFYTCPAGGIIRRHDLRFQLYTDDSLIGLHPFHHCWLAGQSGCCTQGRTLSGRDS